MTDDHKHSPQKTSVLSTTTPDFMEREEGVRSGEIDYKTLVNIATKSREYSQEEDEKSKKIVFFCKDCRKIIEAKKKKGKKIKFLCSHCGGENIYLGTELGINSFFRI